MEQEQFLKIIGENIRKYRKLKGMTLVELGYDCDIEKSNLIPIEKGKINITASTIFKIAKALEIDPFKLFMFEE